MSLTAPKSCYEAAWQRYNYGSGGKTLEELLEEYNCNENQRPIPGKAPTTKIESLAKTPKFWAALIIAVFLYKQKPIYVVYFALAVVGYFIYATGRGFS